MPVLAEIVAAPLLAGIAAVVAAQSPQEKYPADPCRPPAIQLESANLADQPGPDSRACKEARKFQDAGEKKPAKTGNRP